MWIRLLIFPYLEGHCLPGGQCSPTHVTRVCETLTICQRLRQTSGSGVIHWPQRYTYKNLVLEMPRYLYKLPNVLILLLCIGFINLLSHVTPHVVGMLNLMKPSAGSLGIVQLIFGLLGASVGMFIGFLLNQAHSNFQSASALVALEASQINNLDRLLLRFGDAESLKVRTELLAYIESIIHSEWRQMEFDRGCQTTHMMWRSISQKLFKLEPVSPKQVAIYSDILDKAENVAESRELRIDRSAQKLPTIFWVAILFILFGVCSATSVVVPSSEISFAITVFPVIYGSLLGLLIIFDQPFKGKTSVKPKSLVKMRDSIKTRAE